MKNLKVPAFALGLALASTCYAQTKNAANKPSCLIVRHTERGGVATWSVKYRPLEYVWGEFPQGMKFKTGLHDSDVRKIHDKGGRVIILAQNYTREDIEEAKKSCESGEEKAPAK